MQGEELVPGKEVTSAAPLSPSTGERGRGEEGAWRRWFAFLGAGIAWTLHLLSIYAIGEFGCVGGWGRMAYRGISAVAWLILGDSILLLTLALAAAVVGYLDMRKDSRRGTPENGNEGGEYLSKFGVILSPLFTLIIFVETLPVFAYLHGC